LTYLKNNHLSFKNLNDKPQYKLFRLKDIPINLHKMNKLGKDQPISRNANEKESTEVDESLLLSEEEIANPFMVAHVSIPVQTTTSTPVAQQNDSTKDQAVTDSSENKQSADIPLSENVDKPVDEWTEEDWATNSEFVKNLHADQDAEIDNMDIKDEVALWEYCSPDELYMLLKENPARFLPVLEADRELAQKHNCLVTRENKKMRIKFRVYPEDRWTEVGFFENFDDAVIHEEFAEAVQRSLSVSRNRKNPKKMSRKEYLAI
jgi:hypothetical protein